MLVFILICSVLISTTFSFQPTAPSQSSTSSKLFKNFFMSSPALSLHGSQQTRSPLVNWVSCLIHNLLCLISISASMSMFISISIWLQHSLLFFSHDYINVLWFASSVIIIALVFIRERNPIYTEKPKTITSSFWTRFSLYCSLSLSLYLSLYIYIYIYIYIYVCVYIQRTSSSFLSFFLSSSLS